MQPRILLVCERTLVTHVQLFIHQYPQVFLDRAPLNPFIPQPVLTAEIALTQEEDLALGLIEPHKVHIGAFKAAVKQQKFQSLLNISLYQIFLHIFLKIKLRPPEIM